MAFARCPPADVPKRRISAIAAFVSSVRLTPNEVFSFSASRATSTNDSISNLWFGSYVTSIAGSNSKAPMQRFPKKQSVSTGLLLVCPVNASQRSNNARPYVSGRESANIPGSPMNVSRLSPANEYTRPSRTGIIIGEGSILCPMKLLSYSN